MLHDVAGGGVVAILHFAYSVAFAMLLFSGPLVSAAPRGVAALLLGAGLATLVVSLTSAFRFAVAGPDSATVAVLAALLAGVTGSAAGRVTGPEFETLALVSLAGTTVIVGAMLLLFGGLRLGTWVRYVPFPVIGGFLAASGLLLVLGALRLLIGQPVSLGALPDPTRLAVALPVGLAFAVTLALFVARARWRHPMVLPALLFTAGVLIIAAILAFGLTPADAAALGLLMPPVGAATLTLPWSEAASLRVDPALLFGHATEVAVATGVSAVAILLNASGLEVAEQSPVDLDRELRANGISNLLVGACGGVLGNLTLSRSRANRLAGGRSRRSGVIAGLLSLAAIAIGPDVIGWVPKPVVAGLLLFLGLQLILEWVAKASRGLSVVDIALVTAIPLLTVERGYLEAVGLGVVASCIIFAVKYSRIRVVKHDLTRREYGSLVERSPEQTAFLERHGDLIRIMWIQGYLFFGTANRLFESVRTRLAGADGRPIRFLVLDLSNVTGIDSSSLYSFTKIAQRVRLDGATMLLSGVSPGLRKSFTGTEFAVDHPEVAEYPQVDRAVEWAEEQLLGDRRLDVLSAQPFEAWLAGELRIDGSTERLMRYLEVVDLEQGAELFGQGAPADALYLVESGRVSVVLHRPNADSVRLRSVTGYTVVGEMGLYRDRMRTAAVVADRPSRIHRLSKEQLHRMEGEDPALSAAFHAFIVRVLADRLDSANVGIGALQR